MQDNRTLREALDYLEDHDPAETPRVWAAKLISANLSLPYETDTGWVLRRVSITEGRPMHGELRSDTHISEWLVEAPVDLLTRTVAEAGYAYECPQCGSERALYEYNAHHHIAGYWSLTCPDCGHEYCGEDWG